MDKTENTLREAMDWFRRHADALKSEVRTAHMARGGAASEWMREDDRDFRHELDKHLAALASHPPSGLTEHDLYYLRSILRHMLEFQSLCNDAGFGPSVGGEAMFDNIDWLDSFIEKHAGDHSHGG
jgi:hypothetical protein